jgi:hypothetical protein
MNTTEQEVATKATIEEKNTPKKKLDTGILNSFISDLAWENDTKKMDSLKQVYLSFSPEEKEFIDKNAVREGANSIEEVFEKVLPKDAKEKLENKINNFLNTVKQMETTEQKEIFNDVTVGQKFQFKEDNSVLEIVRIDKNAHRDGSDELTMKPVGVNVGDQEFSWSKLALDSAIKEGRVTNVTDVQQLSEKQFTQLNYLKNQVKYLGLGEDPKMHKDLENAILSPEDKTTVRVEYNHPDKLMKGNTVTFDLNIAKTEQGGVFLNSYRANLTTKNGEERSQSFKVQKENSITAKEAINLLEGRSVKIEHDMVDKETGELSRTESFIKLKMKEPKTDYGNYKYEWYNKGYGVDVDNIMQKSNLVFADDIQRERTKKHLEKGNITQATFMHENRQVQGFAVLNPQWKSLNLYDSSMNRLTTQNQLVKPEVREDVQKNNVPQQSISR